MTDKLSFSYRSFIPQHSYLPVSAFILESWVRFKTRLEFSVRVFGVAVKVFGVVFSPHYNTTNMTNMTLFDNFWVRFIFFIPDLHAFRSDWQVSLNRLSLFSIEIGLNFNDCSETIYDRSWETRLTSEGKIDEYYIFMAEQAWWKSYYWYLKQNFSWGYY